MSPKEAKVFIVEDDKQWRKLMARSLERAGHHVVMSAATKPEALKKVNQIKRKGVQVVTLDGNLNPNDTSGVDGQEVLRAIRETAPHVKVIGLSGFLMKGVDVDLGKSNIIKLTDTVTKL